MPFEGNIFFKKIYLFIGKSDIQRGGETERKIFHLMIHSPSERIGQCYGDLKPGSRNFLRLSHTGAGSQSFGPSWTALPGQKQGAGWEVELLGLEPAPIWDHLRVQVEDFSHYSTPPSACLFLRYVDKAWDSRLRPCQHCGQGSGLLVAWEGVLGTCWSGSS